MNAARFMRIGPLKVVLVGALLATVLVALLLMLVAAEDPAEAAFPGKNGKIAFVEFGGGNNEIYTMNADGSNQTQLTTNLGHDSWPAWSPDGTKIAFETDRSGNSEIYTMNADGSAQTNVTNTSSAYEGGPDWQPLPGPTLPTSKAECKNGGYKDFGFKTQGLCLASVQGAANSP